jgi:hypothetical protein
MRGIQGLKYGGNVSEGGKKQGGSEKGGQGPKGGDRDSTKGVGRGSFGDSFHGRETASYGGSKAHGGGSANPDRGGAKASGMSSVAADKMIMDKYLADPTQELPDERSYWDAVRNLGIASNDYNNVNQGFFDDPLGYIGRQLGGAFGIGEIDPINQALGARVGTPTADWGIDPIGAALGLAGAVGPGGIGLLGTGYRGIKNALGWDGPMIAFDGSSTNVGSPIGEGRGVYSNDDRVSTASGIAGLGGENKDRDNQNRRGNTTEQAVNKSASNSTNNNNNNSNGESSQYPLGGVVNPYTGDISQYGYNPMWDWLKYPGQPGFADGGKVDNSKYYNAAKAWEQRNNPKNKFKDRPQNRKLLMEDAKDRADMADANMRLQILQREIENEQYTSPNHRPKRNPSPFKDGGIARHPAGEVKGPGGPKDDLVGPIALSNQEYVLPIEMIKMFGDGDYDRGIDALEIMRKKAIK